MRNDWAGIERAALALGPIVAAAREQPRVRAVAPDHCPVTVELHFVQPIGAARRLTGGEGRHGSTNPVVRTGKRRERNMAGK